MKKVLSQPPLSHIVTMFREESWDALRAEFDVYENESGEPMTREESLQHLPGCSAILTGWGAPAFTREMLDAAPDLQIIAHTAGSVKFLFSDEIVNEVLIPRGITVFAGNNGLAVNVAEATIGMMIMASRRWQEHIVSYSSKGPSSPAPRNGQFLTGATVGLVSASKVARNVIRLLQPFDCRILLFDPYVSPATARGLGVELVKLDELFRQSDIVSLHAPVTAETHNMIGAQQLKKMPDGAVLVNTARGKILDHDALLNEVRKGRIVAALDVTTPEPLPVDSEFWRLPNVILTPHIAGDGYAGYFRIGDTTRDALHDCFAGRPVAGAVPLDKWDILA
ncbi:MAG TPA: hydroxyacid dehydrogenase [Abditibacteriaceae bacterium]|jgi:phosphoglycerate dehydrogenase-like enzyme